MHRLLSTLLLCSVSSACGAPTKVDRARRAYYSGEYEAVWDTLVQAVGVRYTIAYANPGNGVIVTCPQKLGITGRSSRGQLMYGVSRIALRLEGGKPFRVRMQKVISTHNAFKSTANMDVRTDDSELRELSMHVDTALRRFALDQVASDELGRDGNMVTFALSVSTEACPAP